MGKLKNKRHEMFCREYIVDLNGTQAAIRAKFSKTTAAATASRLLTKSNIKERVAELQQESFGRCEIDADYVLKGFKKIADDDIRNYLKFGMYPKTYISPEGDESTTEEFQIISRNSDDIDTWNISEIQLNKDGSFKFKLHCKDNALQQLGRHLKLFTDKVEAEVDSEFTVKMDKELQDWSK